MEDERTKKLTDMCKEHNAPFLEKLSISPEEWEKASKSSFPIAMKMLLEKSGDVAELVNAVDAIPDISSKCKVLVAVQTLMKVEKLHKGLARLLAEGDDDDGSPFSEMMAMLGKEHGPKGDKPSDTVADRPLDGYS
jgi:hypothetical protein